MIGLSAFVAGLAFLLATLACVLVAAAVITRRRLAGLRGAVLAIAYGLVATTLLLAVHMVPGALGILSRGSVLGAAAIALVASLLVRGAPLRARPEPPQTERESRVSWMIACRVRRNSDLFRRSMYARRLSYSGRYSRSVLIE